MSRLKVDGAELNCEVAGEGPLLVVIPGAQGSLEVYQGLSAHLRSKYQVLSYDRRGFGQSRLEGEQDYDRRLDTDADDVAALIAHVGGTPAIVFGSSSGAIVALRVLTRHPEAVRLLVAHEPPACRWLPDPEAAIAQNFAVYDKAKAQGAPAAMQDFAPRWLAPSDRERLAQAAHSPAAAQIQANMAYWFEHELRQYPATRFDIGGNQGPGRSASVGGGRGDARLSDLRRSSRPWPCEFDKAVTILPGGHVGLCDQARNLSPGPWSRCWKLGASPRLPNLVVSLTRNAVVRLCLHRHPS